MWSGGTASFRAMKEQFTLEGGMTGRGFGVLTAGETARPVAQRENRGHLAQDSGGACE